MRPFEAFSLHRVSDVRVFGSVSRGEDQVGSDLDLLVEPTAQTTFAGQ